jgi:hypothetical protein
VLKGKRGIDWAVRSGEPYHLWFHPFNLNADSDAMLWGLEQIFSYANRMRDKGLLDILIMDEYARQLEVWPDMNYLLPAAKQLFLDVDPRQDEPTTARSQMEEEFFSSVRLSNGVFKTTSTQRLDDVNKTLMALFQKLGVAPKTFLDVAVSSGISTIEWFESLQQAGLKPSMTATDLTMTAYLVRLFSWCNVLVDKEGFPLQYDCYGFALRPWSPKRYYVLGDWFLTLLYRTLYWRFGQRLGLLKRLKSLQGNPPPVDDPVIKARVQLVTWRLRDNKDIELLDDDITQPTPPQLRSRFEVIRAANILNRDYFSIPQLREAVRNLRSRLVGPGTFLIIVCTVEPGSNHGTVFRLGPLGSFDVLTRVGRGSEIEDIVLSI